MILTSKQKINLGYIGSIEGCAVNDTLAIELVKNNPVKDAKNVDIITRSYRKYNIDQDYYYVFENANGIDIYKSMPLVHDDNIYHWAERTVRNRVKNLWCAVDEGAFRFNIMVYLSTNDVRINICGRSNFFNPAETIWLRESPTNEDITDAISKWYDEFISRTMISKEMWIGEKR